MNEDDFRKVHRKIKKTKSFFANDELLEIFFARPKILSCLNKCAIVPRYDGQAVADYYNAPGDSIDALDIMSKLGMHATEIINTFDDSKGILAATQTPCGCWCLCIMSPRLKENLKKAKICMGT